MERKTQQGGPVRSRKGRGRNDNPYIEERTRSGNRNARRRGDQQREEQERKGESTRSYVLGIKRDETGKMSFLSLMAVTLPECALLVKLFYESKGNAAAALREFRRLKNLRKEDHYFYKL
ncbi:hypothetical protein TNCV_505281 [Trichonephila clavipes]|nr:hypothetical protein TNCV_505281 [Trichonephila clavipes]